MSSIPRSSEEQLLAVEETESRFSIRAGAGAGKTFVLVQRYLRHIVDEGMSPDQILAITFTKKAAASMKQRIVGELRDRGLAESAQIAETGPIQTVHSFCERVLRENSLEAGIDPEFSVLSEGEAALLREEALRESILTAADEFEESRALIVRVAAKQGYESLDTLHAILSEAVQDAIRGLRESGASMDEVFELHADAATLLVHQTERILSECPREIVQGIESPSNSQALNQLRDAWTSKSVPAWLKSVDPAKDELAARLTVGLVQIAVKTWVAYEAKQENLQRFDFTELQRRAVRLLHRSPEVVARLRGQYRAVLVDEAQDLNPTQYRLLELIGAQREMLVGDPQQSIYGFRDADYRLFQSRVDKGHVRNLTKNFRSTQGILRFVDTVFSHQWPESYLPMSAQEAPSDDPFSSGLEGDFSGIEYWLSRQKDSAWTASLIGELIAEGVTPGDIAVLVRKASAAERIQQDLYELGIRSLLMGSSRQFFARQEIRDLANALEALVEPSRKLPFLALLASPIVGATLDSLVILANESQPLDVVRTGSRVPPADQATLETFLAWFEPLSTYADRLSAWELITYIFERTPFLERLATQPNRNQALANVRKLLVRATESPEQGALEFAGQIRSIRQLGHREGDAQAEDEDPQAVKLMTIHKSKGLEFPVVVLPDGHDLIKRNSRTVVVDSDSALVATKLDGVDNTFHRWVSEQRVQKEWEEEIRAIYVAMTRAQSKLCIVVPDKPTKKSRANPIVEAVSLDIARRRRVLIRERASDVGGTL